MRTEEAEGRIIMAKKLNLDVQTIFDKQFHVDFKGYNPEEVDSFMDLMIQDYQTFQEIIDELNQKNEETERNNASLRAKLIELEGTLRSKESEMNTNVLNSSNVDLIKRISRLEETVLSIQEQINGKL